MKRALYLSSLGVILLMLSVGSQSWAIHTSRSKLEQIKKSNLEAERKRLAAELATWNDANDSYKKDNDTEMQRLAENKIKSIGTRAKAIEEELKKLNATPLGSSQNSTLTTQSGNISIDKLSAGPIQIPLKDSNTVSKTELSNADGNPKQSIKTEEPTSKDKPFSANVEAADVQTFQDVFGPKKNLTSAQGAKIDMPGFLDSSMNFKFKNKKSMKIAIDARNKPLKYSDMQKELQRDFHKDAKKLREFQKLMKILYNSEAKCHEAPSKSEQCKSMMIAKNEEEFRLFKTTVSIDGYKKEDAMMACKGIGGMDNNSTSTCKIVFMGEGEKVVMTDLNRSLGNLDIETRILNLNEKSAVENGSNLIVTELSATRSSQAVSITTPWEDLAKTDLGLQKVVYPSSGKAHFAGESYQQSGAE